MSLWLIRFFSPVDAFGFGIFLIPPTNSVRKNISFFALFSIEFYMGLEIRSVVKMIQK